MPYPTSSWSTSTTVDAGESDDEMTFGEALRYDRLCYDEEARDAYLEGAATIIANTLG